VKVLNKSVQLSPSAMKKSTKGLFYGFALGVVITIMSFIPVFSFFSGIIGMVFAWVWEVVIVSVFRNMELYYSVKLRGDETFLAFLNIPLFSFLGYLFFHEKKWVKYVAIGILVCIVLAIIAFLSIAMLAYT